jgi:hypothetical protein
MDEVRKKSLKEVLPKKGLEMAGKKTTAAHRHKIDTIEEEAPRKTASHYETNVKNPPKISYFMWMCILIVLIVGGYYLSATFASVTIKITPKQLPVAIAGTFEANRSPAEGIEFAVIKLEESMSKQIPATGQKKVETKAIGTVIISNNYSTAAQKLVAGTRIETESGLIFKLDSSVTVPGQTKKGTQITPGTISVKVTASEPGENYNAGTASFKIVGFKGSPRYDKFSVQTKTPISGGKEGMINIVNEDDRVKAVNSMQTELKDKVAKKARLQIPKDYIIFDDGEMNTITNSVGDGTSSSTATITVKDTMIAVLINTKKLSQYFAEQQVKDEPTDGIRISNVQSLSFKLSDKDKFDFEKTKKINFTLNGSANLVWPVDANDLKLKLVSTSIKDKDKVFGSYPAIHRAEAIVRPPWVLSFPNNQDKINIKLVIQ